MRVAFASILSTRFVASLAVIIVVGLAHASDAAAQRRAQWAYRPSTPTISPYLNLLQTNFGPVPNYYSLVRPRLEQQAFNRQVMDNERTQALRIQTLEEDGVEANPITRTGKGGGFMDYLHYFPPPSTRSRQR